LGATGFKKIPVNTTKGVRREALVDEDVYADLSRFRWSLTSHGHPVRAIVVDGRQQTIYMRRVVMGIDGSDPSLWVQTKDRNGLDCRRENLVIRKRYDEKWRETNLWRSYGITLDDYNKMLADQGGVCAICLVAPGEKIVRKGSGRVPAVERRLAVDHCHETGQVRGLLCFECNIALGKLHHDQSNLRRAITYLD
jgi:hypothetical protein